MMRMAEELRDYLADLSRRVSCVFVDLDGGRWIVSELDFIGERIWVRAQPESAAGLSSADVRSRVFDSDVRPGTRLEFVLDDGATVELVRTRSDGELRLRLKNGNGGQSLGGETSGFFPEDALGA